MEMRLFPDGQNEFTGDENILNRHGAHTGKHMPEGTILSCVRVYLFS